MKKILTLLLLSQTILMSSAHAQNDESNPFKEAQDFVASADFPLSSEEILTVFKKVDALAPTLISHSDIPFEWTDKKMVSEFNPFENKLSLYKSVDIGRAFELMDSKKKLSEFKSHVKVVIAHEYGHALLDKNLQIQSSNISHLVNTLNPANNNSNGSIPDDLKGKFQLYLAYHELFADSLAFLMSRNPDIMQIAITDLYGKDAVGNLYARRFLPKSSYHQKLWAAEIKKAQESGLGIYSPYSLLWPQRSIIAGFVEKGLTSKEITHILFQVIIEEVNSWPEDKIEIEAKDLNKRFSEKLLEKEKTVKSDLKTALQYRARSKICKNLF